MAQKPGRYINRALTIGLAALMAVMPVCAEETFSQNTEKIRYSCAGARERAVLFQKSVQAGGSILAGTEPQNPFTSDELKDELQEEMQQEKSGSTPALSFEELMSALQNGPGNEGDSAEKPEERRPGVEERIYPFKHHPGIDYQDMPYFPVSDTQMKQLAEDVDYVSTDEEALQLYHLLMDEYDKQVTMDVIGSLQNAADIANEEKGQEVQQNARNLIEVWDIFCVAVGDLLDGPFWRLVAGEMPSLDWAYAFQTYEPYTEDEKVSLSKEDELIQKYYVAGSQNFTVEYEGETWDIARLASELSPDDDRYWEIYDAICREENSILGPIYLDLVALRAQKAAQMGYRSYTDYTYWEVHGREYDKEEIKTAREEAKEYLVPIFNDLYDYLDENEDQWEASLSKDTAEILSDISVGFRSLGSEVYEAFRYMVDHHLYDCDMAPEKQQHAYTTLFPMYGDPFIYAKMAGNSTDYSTLIHEFGHFNVMYHDAKRYCFQQTSLDVDEVCSLGMEALMLNYAWDMYGDAGEYMYLKTIYNLLENVLDGFAVDEFEQKVYENPEMTLDEMNALMGKIYYEYGFTWTEEPEYTWVEITHNFENPHYYVSYAVSALGALEIWKDLFYGSGAEAIRAYLSLTAEAGDVGYEDALTGNGFDYPLEKGSVKDLAEKLTEDLYVEAEDSTAEDSTTEYSTTEDSTTEDSTTEDAA